MQMHFKHIQVGSDRHICTSYQKDRHIYAHVINTYVKIDLGALYVFMAR